MLRQNLNRQWNFFLGDTKNPWWMKMTTELVDLPHDFSIGQKRDCNSLEGPSVGFFPGGFGFYEKKIYIPHEWEGKKIVVEFEGVYMNATVSVNNQLVTRHPYGYTTFHCDLTPYVKFGEENIISVGANNAALRNSRWYSGSGIYRSVWLLVGESVHIVPWGVSIETPEVSEESSKISVKTKVENISTNTKEIIVRSTLIDRNGNTILIDEKGQSVNGQATVEIPQSLTVSPANLWAVDNPYLYTLKSEIVQGEQVLDCIETKVGIRSISVDPKKGFQLNGVTVKLKGGCVHHDCGLLGAAAYERAEERKVELHKENGYNAIRCAHNPPSPAFLDACDRLGILVIDEAFDGWRVAKNSNDYSVFFDEWWERDLAAMLLRDRNHPCVIMWSTGNEVPERNGSSDGYKYSNLLYDFVKSIDSTRPVTNALNGFTSSDPTSQGLNANMLSTTEDDDDCFGRLSYKFLEPLEVAGYNYLLDRYESDGVKYPNRVICGTETFPKLALEYWDKVESLDHVIGDFVWTSIDYLGEAGIGHIWYNGETDFCGPYPWHQAFCGDIDICGFKRPQSYFRDCVWGVSKAPYIAVYKPEYYCLKADVSRWGWPNVISSWTWPGFESKPIGIEIYSGTEEVELFLNGKSLGRKPTDKSHRYTASYDLSYEPGELVAIGYNNNMEVSRTVLETAEEPVAIRLTPDRSILRSEFGDLSYVTVELVDKNGRLVTNKDSVVTFNVVGEGDLLVVGTGNPISGEMYTGNKRTSYYGKAMAVVRGNGNVGEIMLSAEVEGLVAATVKIVIA